MKRLVLVLGIVMWSTLWAQAATTPLAIAAKGPARAGAYGLSAERLKRVDAFLQRYVDEHRIAGAVVLVQQDGKPVYQRAIGWRDVEAGRPMTPDTVFRIASQTKAVTSVALLSLVEEGRIGLDDPVSRFIPAYAHTTVAVSDSSGVRIVPATRPITIRDLLTHTSGISYGTEPEVASLYAAQGLGPSAGFGWYTADKDEPICATIERLAHLPFTTQPGQAWVYGYSTDVVGCVVERVSGQPLDEFVQQRITGPLGMKDTHFYLPAADRERLATVYASDSDGRITRAPEGAKGQGDYVDGPRHSFAGGAGLLSTAADYARFLEMIRNHGALGAVRILAPRTVALMRTNQIGSLYPTPGMGFGLGFETTERSGATGTDSVGSFGWGGAYGTQYRIDPQAHLVVVLMLQLLPNATDVRPTLLTRVHQALLDAPDEPHAHH